MNEENKMALANLQKEAKLLKERELAAGVSLFLIFQSLKTLFLPKTFQLEMFGRLF